MDRNLEKLNPSIPEKQADSQLFQDLSSLKECVCQRMSTTANVKTFFKNWPKNKRLQEDVSRIDLFTLHTVLIISTDPIMLKRKLLIVFYDLIFGFCFLFVYCEKVLKGKEEKELKIKNQEKICIINEFVTSRSE